MILFLFLLVIAPLPIRKTYKENQYELIQVVRHFLFLNKGIEFESLLMEKTHTGRI